MYTVHTCTCICNNTCYLHLKEHIECLLLIAGRSDSESLDRHIAMFILKVHMYICIGEWKGVEKWGEGVSSVEGGIMFKWGSKYAECDFLITFIGVGTMGAIGAAAPIKFALWGHSIWLRTAFALGRFNPAPIRENIFLRPWHCVTLSSIYMNNYMCMTTSFLSTVATQLITGRTHSVCTLHYHSVGMYVYLTAGLHEAYILQWSVCCLTSCILEISSVTFTHVVVAVLTSILRIDTHIIEH